VRNIYVLLLDKRRSPLTKKAAGAGIGSLERRSIIISTANTTANNKDLRTFEY